MSERAPLIFLAATLTWCLQPHSLAATGLPEGARLIEAHAAKGGDQVHASRVRAMLKRLDEHVAAVNDVIAAIEQDLPPDTADWPLRRWRAASLKALRNERQRGRELMRKLAASLGEITRNSSVSGQILLSNSAVLEVNKFGTAARRGVLHVVARLPMHTVLRQQADLAETLKLALAPASDSPAAQRLFLDSIALRYQSQYGDEGSACIKPTAAERQAERALFRGELEAALTGQLPVGPASVPADAGVITAAGHLLDVVLGADQEAQIQKTQEHVLGRLCLKNRITMAYLKHPNFGKGLLLEVDPVPQLTL